jgi:hypothetical protein
VTLPKQWYTAKELAGLPGMPKTPQAVNAKAKRGVWSHRDRSGRGGGREYALTSLPPETRAHLARQHAGNLSAASLACPSSSASPADLQAQRLSARIQSLTNFDRLPEWQRKSAQAKLTVIRAFETFHSMSGLAKTRALEVYEYEYNMGRIEVSEDARAEVREVRARSLFRWIADEQQLGAMGLVDMYGNRKGMSKIDTYVTGEDADGKPVKPYADAILAIMVREPHVEAKKACEYMLATCPDGPSVSIKSVDRWMTAWKVAHPQEWAWIVNPDKAKGTFKIAFGDAAEGITGPNQRWEIDSTPADLLLTDGRHKIIGIIDVGPRRMKLHVSRTERAADGIATVRRSLLDWGVPVGGVLVCDNGKTYTAEHFQRCARDLEIELHYCRPFASEEKPFIERAFHTFSHDLVEHLPGYCGHSVADRKDIESRASFARRLMKKGELIEMKMTAAELQTFCDRWASAYHDTVHSSLGKSPNQALSECPHAIHRITDERALDVLLAPAAGRDGWRTITKKGVRIDTFEYIHASFGIHVGKQVRCLTTDDVGRIIVQIENEAGVMEHLCVAECPEITGISRAEVTAKAQALQKQVKEEVNALKKRARKQMGGKSTAEVILACREEKAPKNIAWFPRPDIEYSTPALYASAEAGRVLDVKNGPPVQHSPELQAKRAALIKGIPMAEILPEVPSVERPKVVTLQIPGRFSIPEGRKERWQLWNRLHERLTIEFDELSDEELQFYSSFRKSPTWKSFAMIQAASQ